MHYFELDAGLVQTANYYENGFEAQTEKFTRYLESFQEELITAREERARLDVRLEGIAALS